MNPDIAGRESGRLDLMDVSDRRGGGPAIPTTPAAFTERNTRDEIRTVQRSRWTAAPNYNSSGFLAAGALPSLGGTLAHGGAIAKSPGTRDDVQEEPLDEADIEESFVGLNVGGVVHQTTRKTLRSHPDSLLGKLFSGPKQPRRDKDDNIMINGDGAMFKYTLNYLRRGSPCLPGDFREHDLLEKEALFFELPEMVQKVISHKRSSERKESAVIEAYVRERDNCPQEWRIHGSLTFLDDISVLRDYLGDYRKGSQCVDFDTQHSMFPADVLRRFPKTKLFAQIFALGFRLHTTDNVNIIDEDENPTPWLRYVFVK